MIYPTLSPLWYNLARWYARSQGIKNFINSIHRRGGKDVDDFSMTVQDAIEYGGTHMYLFPTRVWAEEVIFKEQFTINGITKPFWEWIIPKHLNPIKKEKDSCIILPHNGARIQLGGTDDLSFVGKGGKSYTMSEFSRHKPEVTGFIVPILRQSQAAFRANGTLMGKDNQLYKMLMANRNTEGWLTQWLKPQDTKCYCWVSDEYQINPELMSRIGEIGPNMAPIFNVQDDVDSGMISTSLARQEYLNEAEDASNGAYYTRELHIMEGEGRINAVYDGKEPVYTFWDLGGDKADSDTTAITFATYNKFSERAEIIDYYEGRGNLRGHYFDMLKSKGYNYGGHYIPHDGKRSNTFTGEGMAETAMRLHDVEMRYIPKADRVAPEIEITRRRLSNVSINKSRCKKLWGHLSKYHESATTGKACHRNNCSLCFGASHGCLTGDSVISVKGGEKRIDEVVVGDQVDLGGTLAVVTNSMFTGIKTVYEITLSDGRSLKCTKDHKIFAQKGLSYADTLRYGDVLSTKENKLWLNMLRDKRGLRDGVILSTKGLDTGGGKQMAGSTCLVAEGKEQSYITSCTPTITERLCGQLMVTKLIYPRITGFLINRIMEIKSIRSMMDADSSSVTTTATISPRDPDSFTDMYTPKRLEQYRMDGTFTTKTKTDQITGRIISKQSLPRIIRRYTQKLISGLGAKEIKDNYVKQESFQKHGIARKRVLRGIARTAKGLGITEESIRRLAFSVDKNTKRMFRSTQNTAQPYVKGIIMLGKEKTYDLTVDHHHAYYANGILVSNSDSVRVLAMAIELKLIEDYINGNPYEIKQEFMTLDEWSIV